MVPDPQRLDSIFTNLSHFQMKFISQVWGLLVNTFLDPFFESIGKVFANIRMHITMNQS